MTDTANPGERTLSAASNLFRVMQELSEAQADVALLERLKGAEARVKRLTAEQQTAVAEQDAAMTAEAEAAEAAKFQGFTDITVKDKRPAESNVLTSTFQITYTRLTFDMDANASVPMPHTCNGFGELPNLAFDYLVDKYPQRIPAKIMALAPGEPREAFKRYFMGLKRGYLKGSLV
ncbi:MAG: hypothetical protein H0W74_14020 [Sphingosinicella sp.]|nr:hypothetical protein [Sphingosinicella sp.]